MEDKFVVVKPPVWAERDVIYGDYVKIFLAGSIEMGKAIDWQLHLTNFFQGIATSPAGPEIAVFNPRRDNWDSSVVQSISNKNFKEQVTWEMDHLEYADIIAMYFPPETKSPISLLELGLHADSGRMIVCCPDGFWRKGNVEMVCDRYKVPLVETFEEFKDLLADEVDDI